MLKAALAAIAAISVLLCQIHDAVGRGGGGFHGGGGFGGGGFGGGGFHGGDFGGGGYRGGDFGGGGYRGGEFGGGYRPGGFEGGYRPSGFEGGYRPGGFDGGYRPGGAQGYRADGFRGDAIGNRTHAGLPSDGGFAHGAAARALTPAGNFTRGISPGTMAARGRNVRNNFWHHDYFNRDWWRNHPGAWFAAGWAAGTAWNWATWPVLGGWYGWGAVDPIYYDYGTNITYQGDQVYYGDAPVGTADQYYQQADAIAQSNPPTKGADDDWTPLGVFGLVQGDQTSASAVFQLATNKSGAIQGNFSDMLTGSTMKVNGAVEKKTQRAAWTVGDNKDIVYETGIYNLTKDEAPILVHFGKDRTQQWMLVRLKQPDGDQQPQSP